MNKLDIDSLAHISFFLKLEEGLLLIKTNKKLYNNKNNIINKLIKIETNINNYKELKKKIINLNKYNIFLDKLLYNNFTLINNYLNLSNNNKEISIIFNNYYKLIKNVKNIKTIKNKLLLKNYIYPLFEVGLKYILTHYDANHHIFFDIIKLKQDNNQLEMYINYNNTYKNHQKFNLLYLFISIHKFI